MMIDVNHALVTRDSKSRSEQGLTLVEVLVALAILAITGAGLFGALQLSSSVLATTDVRDTAKDLAELQIEYVKGLPYADSYAAALIPPGNEGYMATVSSTSLRDGNLQKITVTVDHNGVQIISIDDYKVKW
jgi:prepilin-type N-terminal cleavage/methylation domain-containing protein